MPLRIIRNDIARVEADAIVNTANPRPVCGAGTERAIYEAAGRTALLAERKKIGEIEPGEAKHTPALALNAKYIIHTVGPVWEGGAEGEAEILQSCYENSLKLALKLGCKSVAFPLIATGSYGFPKDKALQIALSTVQSFLMANPMDVLLVVFDKISFKLSETVVDKIAEFVDANYVESAGRAEYAESRNSVNRLEITEARKLAKIRAAEKKLGVIPKRPKNISEFAGSTGGSFQEKFFEYADKTGKKASEIYKPYGITKQVYSKMQCNKDYRPSKYTAVALCLSLGLDLEQTEDLLSRAGYSLSPGSRADMVIKGCIVNGIYDLKYIDSYLDEHAGTCFFDLK